MNFKAESNPLLPIFCIQSIPYSSLYLRSESTSKARNRIKPGSQVHFYVNLTYSRFAWSSTFLCKTGNHPLSQKKKTIWNCNEMGMSKWWQMVHFGVKYSFKPWYVNKAFSEISHPYQHTREYRTNQNYTTERTLSQCVTTHRIKYTTSSMVKGSCMCNHDLLYGYSPAGVIRLYQTTQKPWQSHTMECNDYFRKRIQLLSHAKEEL